MRKDEQYIPQNKSKWINFVMYSSVAKFHAAYVIILFHNMHFYFPIESFYLWCLPLYGEKQW